jgi:UV DNA damage repair endonuclease
MKTGVNERPQLGLVCITASDEVRFRTMTRKRLLQLDAAEPRAVLDPTPTFDAARRALPWISTKNGFHDLDD